MATINVIGLTGGVGGAAVPFDVADLFSGGENGLWYDPNDKTSLFTGDMATSSSAGTAGDWDPVATSTIRFMIDKRLVGDAADFATWLAAETEVILDSTMTGTTEWTEGTGVTHDSGNTQFDFDGTTASATLRTDDTTLAVHNEMYAIEVVVSNWVAGTARVEIGDGTSTAYSITGDGTYNFVARASVGGGGTLGYFGIESEAATPFDASIDSFSAKSLGATYAHTNNATNVLPPTVEEVGVTGVYYLAFPGGNSSNMGLRSIVHSETLSTDSVILYAGASRDAPAQYYTSIGFGAGGNFNLGQAKTKTTDFYPSVFMPGITVEYAETVTADESLVIWEFYLDETARTMTIDKNDSNVHAANSVAGAASWSGGGQWFLGANTNGLLGAETDFYGMIVYEASSFNQSAYDWLDAIVNP